jgi:hypothetical protein
MSKWGEREREREIVWELVNSSIWVWEGWGVELGGNKVNFEKYKYIDSSLPVLNDLSLTVKKW